jgi:large subunit ribosomal protein L22
MQARAVARYVRMSPRKVQQVARLVRGMGVEEATALLLTMDRRAARPLRKTIQSAAANLQSTGGDKLKVEHMVVREVAVDSGPTLLRFRARAMGRVARIRKRTSHIRVTVEDTAGGR